MSKIVITAPTATATTEPVVTDTTTPAPFVWDRDYDNHEQVRSYMAGFVRVYNELAAAGQYPYNDSFKGRIPGIEGANEDTAIYMLQNLKSRDELDEQISDFLANGGSHLADADLEEGTTYRGTVVSYGFYMGGTGWRQHDKTRFTVHTIETRWGTRQYLHVYMPRKRNPIRVDGNILIRVAKR